MCDSTWQTQTGIKHLEQNGVSSVSAALDTAEADEAEKPAQAGGREGVQFRNWPFWFQYKIDLQDAHGTWWGGNYQLILRFKQC